MSFTLSSKTFSQQFSSLYSLRLALVRPLLTRFDTGGGHSVGFIKDVGKEGTREQKTNTGQAEQKNKKDQEDEIRSTEQVKEKERKEMEQGREVWKEQLWVHGQHELGSQSEQSGDKKTDQSEWNGKGATSDGNEKCNVVGETGKGPKSATNVFTSPKKTVENIPVVRENPLDWLRVTGTLFKQMKNRPSIVEQADKIKLNAKSLQANQNLNKEIKCSNGIVGKGLQTNIEVFCAADDILFLEDDSGRMNLILDPQCKITKDELVTGVVCCVVGYPVDQKGGEFIVKEIFFPGLQKQLPIVPSGNNKFVLFVSGLANADLLKLQLLGDFITSGLSRWVEGSIAKTIVAGGLIPPFTKKLSNDIDIVLTQMASAAFLDVMPGEGDPSNVALPQQPFHPCLFPAASSFSTFTACTNPYSSIFDGVEMIGTSGQNVFDLKRCSVVGQNSSLQHLEQLLKYGHLAPTAPDTLPCYPYTDTDPFILHSAPHIFFCGNQPSFQTSVVSGSAGQRVRVLSIPSFAESSTVALVNIDSENMDCFSVCF